MFAPSAMLANTNKDSDHTAEATTTQVHNNRIAQLPSLAVALTINAGIGTFPHVA